MFEKWQNPMSAQGPLLGEDSGDVMGCECLEGSLRWPVSGGARLSQGRTRWCHAGSLKSAIVGGFTPRKLANPTYRPSPRTSHQCIWVYPF